MIISLSEPEAKCSKSPYRPATGLEAVVRRDHGCLRGVNLSRVICNGENPLNLTDQPDSQAGSCPWALAEEGAECCGDRMGW